MFFYYLRLAALSYRRNPILSSLMVLAVAVGIAAYMIVFTLNYTMGGDPIPHKSSQLFAVQLDNWDPNTDSDPPQQLTYTDAMALQQAGRAWRQTASSKFSGIVEPDNPELRPFMFIGRGAYADFFPMFDVPFQYGSGWSADADANLEQVTVLSRDLNERLFGGANSVGETITMDGTQWQVIGVLDRWDPVPKFYDVNNGPFDSGEELYIPWGHVVARELPRSGNTNCWTAIGGSGFQAFLNSECVWIQYWVELRDANEEAEYLDFINGYVQEQKTLGRFGRPLNNALYDVNEWLLKEEVLPDETSILSMLAAMLLAVCLLNTIGLLLAKFLGKSAEIGARQALGAHKGSLFIQHMIEAGFIGLLGGLLGLLLAHYGLEGVKILLGNELMMTDWIQLNVPIVITTIALAIVSTVIAGLYPIWRACNINPAIHLKTQ
ncbi:MAG: ABC transporter permease [Pseudomonadales bacterium]|nr:ABC transporter permease [Pseudomonadales bacterium]